MAFKDLDMMVLLSREGRVGAIAHAVGETDKTIIVDRIGVSDTKRIHFLEYPEGREIPKVFVWFYGIGEETFHRVTKLRKDLDKAHERLEEEYEDEINALYMNLERDANTLDQQYDIMLDLILSEEVEGCYV